MGLDMQQLQHVVSTPEAAVSLAKYEYDWSRKHESKDEATKTYEYSLRSSCGSPVVDEVAETVEEEVLEDNCGDEDLAAHLAIRV